MWRRVFLKIKDLCKQNIEFMMAVRNSAHRKKTESRINDLSIHRLAGCLHVL